MRLLLFHLLTWVAVSGFPATLQEDFANDPFGHGWSVYGDTNLFHWDSTNQNLLVTWDSSTANSFFHVPLHTVLTRSDAFEVSFDLYLDDIAIGTTDGKPDTFPIAVSMFNLAQAQRTNLYIGTGVSAAGNGLRNDVEFDYFPDAGFGATCSLIAVSGTPTNYSQFVYSHDYPTPLDPGVWHHITMAYDPASQQLTLKKQRNGEPYGAEQSITLRQSFGDFRLDTFAVSSYSDYVGLGSALAHGRIDNVLITVPDPPLENITLTLTNGPLPQVGFASISNWTYVLERSQDALAWSPASPALPGTGSRMTLEDTNAPMDRAFYRVRAQRP